MVLRHLAAALIALALLAGCSDDDSGSATDVGSSDEPTPTATTSPTRPDDPQCPGELPTSQDGEGLGLGADDPASEAPPAFDTPPMAWVCSYALRDPGPGDGDGDERWVRNGPGTYVPDAELPELATALSDLEPAPEHAMCTADFGPRLLLVLPREDGLTGIVVDDFGCRDVRMTDDPFATTALGAEDGDGTVAGVLTGSPSLHAILEVVAPR